MYKPVSVPKAAFVFCRFSLAILLWVSLLLHLKWLVAVCFVIFLLSAILKVQRAPMIFLYSNTINRIFKSKEEVLDEKAMRFIHSLASFFSLFILILLYFFNERIGWGVLFFFAVLKSISAVGFCPAGKLYSCATGGGSCCSFVKRRK